ncbi:MAG: hypothetical protein LBK60_11335 [Verrucomicrobiales bacterium]|jgi:hypothetical protein|nr:hypothetical protein [Verrucomicrobiales bacterium]
MLRETTSEVLTDRKADILGLPGLAWFVPVAGAFAVGWLAGPFYGLLGFLVCYALLVRYFIGKPHHYVRDTLRWWWRPKHYGHYYTPTETGWNPDELWRRDLS